MRVSLSDDAYQNIIKQARRLHYIADTTTLRHHGLALYVAAIAEYGILVDARPAYVVELDMQLLEAGRLPIWMPDMQRNRRTILVTPQTAADLRVKALALGVTNYHRAGSLNNTASVLGVLLEAIGVNWIALQGVPYYELKKRPATRTKTASRSLSGR